jgi:NAD-dependent SIR2 family protein deacetylase
LALRFSNGIITYHCEFVRAKIGGIKMNSCMRCGEKLSHNYLVAIFTIINEKRERVIVCLKCKEILNKKGK